MNELSTIIETAPVIAGGGIVVIPTDTIYGIIGQAQNKDIVERIYQLKKRRPSKPFIILVSSYADIEKFTRLSSEVKSQLESYWPGPVSVILDCPDETFDYLHRGSFSLAFRMPATDELRDLIKQTGPLVAPSANPEGLDPAKDTDQAFAYFGESVDGYVSGVTSDKPSKVIRFDGNKEVIIRP